MVNLDGKGFEIKGNHFSFGAHFNTIEDMDDGRKNLAVNTLAQEKNCKKTTQTN